MEANEPAHLVKQKEEHREKKRIKLDRSGLGLKLSKTDTVSNGVKKDVTTAVKNSEKAHCEMNNVKPSEHQEKQSLKRPAADDDDIPLVARSKLKLSSENSATNSSNDVKKIKKIKHETNSSVEKAKKPESGDSVKKVKSESSSSISNKSDSVKKLKPDSGEGAKKVNTASKTDGIKKIKTESGLASPSKSNDIVKKTSSPVKSDGTKKIKHAVDTSVKVKSESVLKSPEAKKSKDGLLSPKTENKEKVTSGSSPKLEASKSKEGSSIKGDKSKTLSTSKERKESSLTSPKSDSIKKEKHKTNSSKLEGKSKSDKASRDSSGLTSPKVDGVKKEKMKLSSSSSPKVDGIKKIKSESGISPEKKVKDSSDSTKEEEVKKSKSKNSVSAQVKVKTESDAGKSSSSKEKTTTDSSDDDDVPLAARAKTKPESDKKSASKERKRKGSDSDDDDDYKPLKKLKKKSDVVVKKEKTKSKGKPKKEKDEEKAGKGKEAKKGKEKKEEEVWKWWEEEKHPDGVKWLTLEHKGPYFPPEYEPLPDNVNFYYDDEKIKLSVKSEEVAGFYAKMLDHDYTSKKIFNDNFFQDWRKEMTDEERGVIKHLSKCDFKEMHAYYVQKNEERKNMTKEEKLVIKEKNEVILQEYGYCLMDGHKERVGNFKIEPPGLFRGRGDHPKQGKLKKRLKAKDVIINIGKNAKVPDPPEGQRWKAIQHDNKVTWLACWIENIQGSYKYVMLNPTSRIKGEKDWQKYETARKLKNCIHKIRADYTNDWKAKEMRIRQRGVALYFIDKLALRAGHEKDEDTADTVGCCSLRYEHIKLHKKLDDKEYVVEFDFLGKDSIHYHNIVQVEKRVFKNLELFQHGKSDGDDLFDRLTTASLNKYLSELMEGLSAKVFRTYNASKTLQDQLNQLEVEDNVAANVLGYNRANRAVAILCNHQRSVPKTFEQSMSNLQQKIDDKKKAIKDANNELKDLKHEAKQSDSVTLARKIEKKKTAIERLKEQLFKLEVSQTDKNENKEIALGTSKLNYLDPRISIAWCLKNNVPIEKIYNKTQRQKFAWAIDMTEEDFVF